MEVHPITGTTFNRDPLRHCIARLLRTLGTPQFEAQLFSLVDEAVGCEHLTAFAVPQPNRPRLLFAANRGKRPIARTAAHTYMQKHWSSDPTNTLLQRRDASPWGMVACVSTQELMRLTYRRQCYSREDWEMSGKTLGHKMTLIGQRDHEETIKVNLYRRRDAGPFSHSDIQRMAESADLLFALLAAHLPVDTRPDTASLRQRYQTALEHHCDTIPEREAQVCACIAAGLSSEAIALTLGTTLNTILTYRKRAYARLRISSQNELMRQIYESLRAE